MKQNRTWEYENEKAEDLNRLFFSPEKIFKWEHEKVLNIINYQAMPVKTTVRCHLMPAGKPGKWLPPENTRSNACWWGCGDKATLVLCWCECELVLPPRKAVWRVGAGAGQGG